eukprot:TRINITY_DN13575_c0_g1_i1.p1 TRINITY_DN13575_c0_g1~~TRINITY_DN13575_c0_g1_i1.p1  ORF type:complete len:237 (+),score=23.43 TRINITY_DN13575_c0_g1_i1:68-778(+)
MSSEKRPVVVALVVLWADGEEQRSTRPLLGRPLCHWALAAMVASCAFHEVWVITDNAEIADATTKCRGVQAHLRCGNALPPASACREWAAAHPDFDVLCFAQAMCPLVKPHIYSEAVGKLLASPDADSLISVVRSHTFEWAGEPNFRMHPVGHEVGKRPRRQDWSGRLVEDGTLYLQRKEAMAPDAWLLGERPVTYETPFYTQIMEVLGVTDWGILEALARRYGYQPPEEGVQTQD